MRSARRERENQSRRERYASDPAYREKRLTQSAAAYAANPEPKKARNRAWWAADADRGRSHTALRRARLRTAAVEHVSALVVLERDDGVCGICGRDVDPQDFHIDHVVPLVAGGRHAYDNVQAAHPACNLTKGAG